MYKIALTGNIGTGKTTVAKIFESLRIPVFYSDYQAKELYKELKVKKKIIESFGVDIIDVNGNIDLQLLSKLIFADKKKLEIINELTHPLVFEEFDKWASQFNYEKYVLLESAIIFESPIKYKFDKIITVFSPINTCEERIIIRDNINKIEFEEKYKTQLEQEFKIKHSDYTICNDGSKSLIEQVIEIHKKISSF